MKSLKYWIKLTVLLIKKFLSNDRNLSALKRYFQVCSTMYQYIFSMVFPKYYTQNNRFGVQNKKNFYYSL